MQSFNLLNNNRNRFAGPHYNRYSSEVFLAYFSECGSTDLTLFYVPTLIRELSTLPQTPPAGGIAGGCAGDGIGV